MSGIAALFARGGAPADGALLARVIAGLRPRGPDGEGVWLNGSIGLGHTLHATTSEAPRETSPALLEDRLVISADARIDARDELRDRLRAHGRDLPADAPDPALILHAYDAWGEGCLPLLLGDFSFALWDAARRQLVCAVDPLGARAFFHTDRGGAFVGSNSLQCVRLHGAVRDRLDERAVGDFILLGGYEDRDVTIYADVARIPPGHFLVVDDGGARLARYFDWPPAIEARGAWRHDCVEEFRELLARAVRDRLRTPRVAVLMSGGVDSPLIALTAKRELARASGAPPEIRAYCAVYDDLIPDDERRHAALVANHLTIPIDFQPMDGGALFDWVGRLSPDEPTADVMLGPFLDQLDRIAHHSAVVLTGYDGDALLRAAMRWHWRERAARGEVAALARDLAWYVRIRRALPPIGLRTFIAARRHARAPRDRPGWLLPAFWTRADLARRWAAGTAPTPVSRSRDPAAFGYAGRAWGAFFDVYGPGTLGRAIEFRHPLLDLRLIRFALSLPAIPWCVDKHLLRRCLEDLPAAIRRRPKTPLAADPVAALIRRRGVDRPLASRPAEELAPFIDQRALDGALGRAADPAAEPGPALRALALSLWLEQRAADRARSFDAQGACYARRG